jgi:hypothetical protein
MFFFGISYPTDVVKKSKLKMTSYLRLYTYFTDVFFGFSHRTDAVKIFIRDAGRPSRPFTYGIIIKVRPYRDYQPKS